MWRVKVIVQEVFVLSRFLYAGFKSDSEGPGEGDVDSRRSYNYDDIDEMAEDQPLTPQGSVVHATKPDKTDKGLTKF